MANKVIILEGPDGSGKTTLAEHLQNHGYAYHHEGPPPPLIDPLIHYGQTLFDLCHSGRPVVADRLHVGELIYGPIIRKKTSFSREGMKLMNRLRSAYGPYLLFCMPPFQTAYGNWKERKGELFKKDDVFEQVYTAYEDIIRDPLLNYAGVWDYTRSDAETTAKMLSLVMDKAFEHDYLLPKGMIGSPNAKFLFVGEVANHDKLDLPFFATTNSSRFFNDCLEQAGFVEYEIALVNALHLDGHPFDFRWDKRFEVTVALGNKPSEVLTSQGINHITIPHPAYWKRFHSRFTGRYVDQLAEVRGTHYAAQ